MKNIIFIAPPAAGKGTMSAMLVEKYGYVHISTGDLLREAKNKNDEFGKNLAAIMSSGKLVPDEIVLELLSNRIKMDDCKNGFILDGYPRNVLQIGALMDLFVELNIDNYTVIYLDIEYEEAIKRTLGRLTCPKCKSGFNKFKDALKPKVEGICDKCGSALETRADDTSDTFKIRYETYMDETKPVVDYFMGINKIKVVKVTDNPQEMLLQIEKILEV